MLVDVVALLIVEVGVVIRRELLVEHVLDHQADGGAVLLALSPIKHELLALERVQ